MCTPAHTRGRRAAALVPLLLVAIAATLWPARAPARPLITGVTDPETTPLGSQLVFDRIRDANARFVRLSLLWRFVAPKDEPLLGWDPTDPADPNYDWGGFDREVRAAARAGLTPLVQVYSAPSWAQGCDTNQASTGLCDTDPGKLAQFATAAARRYNGHFQGLPRLRYWEAGNEPNLDSYFAPQFRNGKPVAPILYRRLLDAFAKAVRNVDGSNLIVGPGLAPLEFPGRGLGPLDFMRRMLCMKGRAHPRPAGSCPEKSLFDVWATNPYTTGGPTHHASGKDDVSLGDLPKMTRLLRAAERAGRIGTRLHPVPFWVTELSWDSRPPDPGGLPWRIQARWGSEAIYRAWSAGVSAFFWFGLRDGSSAGTKHYLVAEGGLYLRGATLADDKPKRLLRAFRFPFVAFTAHRGIRVWGRTPESTPGRVAVEVKGKRGWRRIARLQADRNGIFRDLIRTGYGSDSRGLVRARYRGKAALPFSLHNVPDFYQPAFGKPPPGAGRPSW